MLTRESIELYIQGLEKSPNTCESYRRDLTQLCIYLTENPGKTPADYIEQIKTSKSPATVVRIMAGLHGYFRYQIARGEMTADPLEGLTPPRIEARPKREFTFTARPGGYALKAVRDRAMLAVMKDTGFKVTKLLSIKMSEIPELQLSRETIDVLDDYIYGSRDEILKGNASELLFTNLGGGPMSRQGFWKMLKQYGDYQN